MIFFKRDLDYLYEERVLRDSHNWKDQQASQIFELALKLSFAILHRCEKARLNPPPYISFMKHNKLKGEGSTYSYER